MRMRDKGILFEDDSKQVKLRLKEDIVAYVNMPAKGEKGLPFLLLRDVVIDETLTIQDDPGEYELVVPGPQEYLLSLIVLFKGEGELEDTSTIPRDSDSDSEDTYEDPQEFEPPPPVAAPIVLARPQRSTANKPPTRYENELAK
jgi:hypothetical protein